MNITRVRAVYDELEKYEVELASDPRSLGPLYLQNTIAKCRNYLNLVGRIQLEVHREKQDVSRRLRAAETAYEVSFAEVLSGDERVRRLPSIEDRKATANVILRDQLNAIVGLKAELHDLEFVDKAVRHRHKELTSTMSEVKLQRSLIRDEIDSGAMYGDERAFDHDKRSNKGPVGLGDDVDEEEIAKILAESTGEVEPAQATTPQETHLAVPDPVVDEPVVDGPAVTADDQAKVEAFLTMDTDLREFENVFDNL